MNGTAIATSGLTKDYGHHRGIFDVTLDVHEGEVFGFVGTNGSGKTTTIRHLMGFIRPDRGSAAVGGLDAWRDSADISPLVGYVPGEIAFPRVGSGLAFLRLQADYCGLTDFRRMNDLIGRLQLDPTADLRRMSKGMKQKTALVAALMCGRPILIMDEPTTGLDPLMRDAFLDIIREEKAAGHTVLMSSQIFEEMEEACDRVAMIHDGHILGVVDIHELHGQRRRTFTATFADRDDARRFMQECGDDGLAECAETTSRTGARIGIAIDQRNVGTLIGRLKDHPLLSLSEEHETLEDRFMAALADGDFTS